MLNGKSMNQSLNIANTYSQVSNWWWQSLFAGLPGDALLR